ncbi:dipeptide/oligopeptide/nickel ABC transporter permease/ATP-binding protein [Roseomonas sp. HJA6]|uniref:Dipeptide/oligopeptide/nickel ABC transporter permease/ATP-binding protein n=1 Tax=Roseomonas alba TaxID=2846776 RepID=A0ABS7A7J1_9PROT|nr:dipeptide/oligopeptide/nickel ABC transporter permease/ATP-binding protein [Neoroseomonas alba]MBW6398247.1 dipeptide/oligopeptide/nickel ABC transporter permease/ATP-binding protein [Neoroseomonas alba]
MRRINPIPLAAVGIIALLALLVPYLGLPDPVRIDVPNRLAGPSWQHLLGQDEVGRDILSRLLWGARSSLTVALLSATIACVIGTALGVMGGFLGGVVDLLTIRAADIVLCFPPLLLALLVVTLLGPGAATLIPVLALVYLPGFVRVAYAGVLSVRHQEYVEAQRALGVGKLRIMLRTVLPNIGGPVLVQFSLAMASAVVLESGLSFLGLGVVPPSPSWGLMIGAARSTMAQTPLPLLWPCLALTLTVLSMNALCDAVRAAVDPHGVPPRQRRWLLPALLPGLPFRAGASLAVRDLTVAIDTPAGAVRPVRSVSWSVAPGETLAIVGESGSGKSLTGLAVLGLLPLVARPEEGAVLFGERELLRMDEAALRRLRGAELAMIFQDPMSSLNPVHRIGTQIVEAIRAHRPLSRRSAWQEAVALLARVGIPDAARRARSFPHELSGGMRQRAMIAMAIANRPTLLIADEPTTALDVTIQAQVLELLAELKAENGMGLVFITHALPVVAEIADRVVVMYAGEVVEHGPVAEIFTRPLHPYTAALLRSAPPEDGSLPQAIPGTVPLPQHLPAGCAFAPRCVSRRDACEAAPPPLEQAAPGHDTRCIRWREWQRLPVTQGAEA